MATPGQIVVVVVLTAAIRSSRIGDGGAPCGVPSITIETAVSLTIRLSVDVTYSEVSSGCTRQFTFAPASCGRAFLACPPSSCVATHVVRSVAFHAVVAAATRLIAAVSPFETFMRSPLIGPFSMPDIALKYDRVMSLTLRGNANFDNRSSAPAR